MSDDEQGSWSPEGNDLPTRAPEGPSTPEDRTAHVDKAAGQRLGDFELIRELGRGGMGIVYEARQISLARRVALKILHPGLELTGDAVERFEREARAAGGLHHTHIVPVFATGEAKGCHYFAMELVDGEPLSRILQDLRSGETSPLISSIIDRDAVDAATSDTHPTVTTAPTSTGSHGPGPSGRRWFDTVARLLADAADALHHAHEQGIVHRDVKPANLMLSRDGRLCLTDFGLARLTREPGLTATGAFMGSPAYMSPETVSPGEMPVDHRTDVYSLGVVLYEMLTLRRAFPEESSEHLLSAILTKDPTPPRRINSRVPLDLQTICQKAMEKNPAARYLTAGELAQDLRRYLRRELIAARPAGPIRRATKFIHRHALLSSVTAVVLLAVVVIAIVGSVLWSQRVRDAARGAVADARYLLERGEYRAGLDTADEALRLDPGLPEARLVRARLLMQLRRHRELVEEAQALVRTDPDDWVAHMMLAFAATQGGVRTIDAAEHVEAVERLAPDTAETLYLRALLADSHQEAIGLLDAALEREPGHPWALMARSERYKALADFPASLADIEGLLMVRPRSTRGRRHMAALYKDLHDYSRAIEEFGRAIEIDAGDPAIYLERSWTHASLGEREQAIADLTRAIELEPDRSESYRHRAENYRILGKSEEALADAHKALELDPDNIDAYRVLIRAVWSAEPKDESALRSVLDRLKEASSRWTGEQNLADAAIWVSWGHGALRDYEEALAQAEKAVALAPDDLDAHLQLAWVRKTVEGMAGIEEGCRTLATLRVEDLWDDKKRGTRLDSLCDRRDLAIESLTRTIERAPHWADPYYERARLLRYQGDYAVAIEDLGRAIERAPEWSDPYRIRGLAHMEEKRYEESLADISKAIELAPDNADAIYNRGRVHFAMRRYEDALTDFEACFRLRSVGILHGQWFQARALLHLGRQDEALAVAEDAIENNPQEEIVYTRRATLLRWMGRPEDAIASLDSALEVLPRSGVIHEARGWHRMRTGRLDRARVDLTKALELDTRLGSAHLHRATISTLQGRLEEALADCERAIELDIKEAHGEKARVLLLLGRQREAREHFDKAVEIGPPSRLLAWEGRCLALKPGSCSQSTAALRRAGRPPDDDGEAWLHLARAHLDGLRLNCPGEYSADQALDHARRTVEADPLDEHARNTLGVTLYRNGRHAEAFETLREVLDGRGEGSVDLFVLAMSAWRLDRKDEARAYYRRGVDFVSRNRIRYPVHDRLREEASRMIGGQDRNRT